MILPVYLYGHPVLRQEAEDITPDYPELSTLINDMWETMYHSEGVGLAAPQIGRSIALIVLDGSVLADTFPECADSKMVIINPQLEVIEDSPLVSRAEGCLSLPDLSENVKRHEHIRLTWCDENFVEHEKEFTGFLSRIIQHEYDHLLGEVYIDHVAPIRRQLIRTKLNNIVKGKVKCGYKTKAAPAK
ncbi:MAG: peptide deformylase [Bacteroidales bacterium]|nr:peptide deformylase [Bacteroidales bacterium]MBD5212696.1 peptide deformylase [Bacteroidales bacterium]MBD5217282.1 peptide deformylase [Bacteroidales bacterium]